MAAVPPGAWRLTHPHAAGRRPFATEHAASIPPPPRFTHAQRQRLERAADHYLQRCYRAQTTVRASEFAKSLGVTHRYLSRVVPGIVGKSLREFLRAKQLVYAETLLRATPLTIAEIAVRSGFGTETTFHRCFREAYGMTPAHFREVKK